LPRWGRWLIPGATVPSITAVSTTALRRRGITALIVDLDNTLTRWNEVNCPPEVRSWFRELTAAGIRCCIASNNGPARVRAFLQDLGLEMPWVARAGKPWPRAYRACLQRLGNPPRASTAAVGDQVFTDVLGGNMAGLFTILVRPLARREFAATRVLRAVEAVWLRRLEGRGALRAL